VSRRPCGQRIALVVWQDHDRAHTGLSAVEILRGQDLAVLAVQQAVSCHDPDLARNGLVITADASFELSDPTLKSCHLACVLLKAPVFAFFSYLLQGGNAALDLDGFDRLPFHLD